MRVTFNKSGKEIKAALQQRRTQLRQRLERRNAALDEFMRDSRKVRSYLIRSSETNYGHGRNPSPLYGPDDISSEEKEEISQLCQRIYDLEQELCRLALIEAHLDDKQIFELSLEELTGYGFAAEGASAG